jgi:N-methylhydantoinase B
VRTTDPVTFEVIRNALLAIVGEMKTLVMRSSYTTLWREAGDLSCALMNTRGEVIAQGPEDIPVHIASLPYALSGMLERIGVSNLEPGDILFQNDPMWGNNHLPDCVMAKPLYSHDEIIAYSMVRGHWADIGGIGPGSYSSVTTDPIQEGLRIPPLKLYKRGRLDEEISDLILANVRGRPERMGDMRAQFAGCHTGEQKVLALVGKYGKETILGCFEDILDHSEHLTLTQIGKLRPGSYEFVQYCDGDGVTDDSIRIAVRLDITPRRIAVDFAGSSPQVRGGMNSPFAVTNSATYYAIKCVTDPSNPANSGSYRPVTVTAPRGSVVNPLLPAPVILGNHETASIVASAVFGALEQACEAMPDRTIAGGSDSATLLVFGGKQSRGGRPPRDYVCIDLQGVAWGARYDKDGISGLRVGVGNTGNQPVEVIESEFPLRVESSYFVEDAGGPGKFRGGLPMRRTYHVLDETLLTVVGERNRFPAYGLANGCQGQRAEFVLNPGTAAERVLFSKTSPLPLPSASVVVVQPASGGGYGDPLTRDPRRVAEDVLNGYVSAEGAARDYGVVLDEASGRVNEPETQRLRERRS